MADSQHFKLNELKIDVKKFKTERNTTKTVLIMCLVFLLGNVPNSISPLLFTFGMDQIEYEIYILFGNFMLYTSRSSYFFIYFFFNDCFRQAFTRMFQIK